MDMAPPLQRRGNGQLSEMVFISRTLECDWHGRTTHTRNPELIDYLDKQWNKMEFSLSRTQRLHRGYPTGFDIFSATFRVRDGMEKKETSQSD